MRRSAAGADACEFVIVLAVAFVTAHADQRAAGCGGIEAFAIVDDHWATLKRKSALVSNSFSTRYCEREAASGRGSHLLAQRRRDLAALRDQLAKRCRRQRLIAVAHRLFRVWMHFDDQTVRARGDRRDRHR